MSACVADTHAVIWYLMNDPRLSPVAFQPLITADHKIQAANIQTIW
jgi:PIN domain nuclease of toxin-antitoxin system